MNHVMIDLETLDTTPSAVILSLGAVKFNPETRELDEQYYERFEFAYQTETGRTKSISTLDWWNKQDPKVKDEAFGGKEFLHEVLEGSFKEFLGHDPIVWGNGSTFDISILEHAYDFKTPWKFWNVRDVRTIVELARGYVDRKDFTIKGDAHNALADAIHQAKYVSAMCSKIRAALARP